MKDKTGKKTDKHINDDRIFYGEMEKLLSDEKVRSMSRYKQHFGTNTLKHSIRVAQTAFELSNRLGWEIDEKELARGALLHDYYQYSVLDERLDAVLVVRRRVADVQSLSSRNKASADRGEKCGEGFRHYR